MSFFNSMCTTHISAWAAIIKCAYNSSEIPRTSIYKDPFCYDRHATEAIKKAMASLSPYHKYRLEYTLQSDAEET
jgi:hypothetical protein